MLITILFPAKMPWYRMALFMVAPFLAGVAVPFVQQVFDLSGFWENMVPIVIFQLLALLVNEVLWGKG